MKKPIEQTGTEFTRNIDGLTPGQGGNIQYEYSSAVGVSEKPSMAGELDDCLFTGSPQVELVYGELEYCLPPVTRSSLQATHRQSELEASGRQDLARSVRALLTPKKVKTAEQTPTI